jgi:hypothetical protein
MLRNHVVRRKNTGLREKKHADSTLSVAPLTGIAKMVCHKKIILACCAVQKFAHQLLATLRVLENAQVKHGQSELKILVSVVRFRPRPPVKPLQALETTLFKR